MCLPLIAVLMVPTLFAAAPAHTAVPVVGDAKLLQRIRQSIAAKRVEYPQGELVARYHEFRPKHDETRATVRTVWSGDKQYWEYSSTYHDWDARLPNGETEFHEEHVDVRQFISDGLLSRFAPGSGLGGFLLIKPPATRNGAHYLLLRPRDRWYRLGFGVQSWDQSLDPEKPITDSFAQFRVDREGDSVTVTKVTHGGNFYKSVFSISQGLNLIHYETIPKKNAVFKYTLRSGRYEWQSIGDGRWYPRKIVLQDAHWDTPDDPFWVAELVIESFDPNPQIPPGQFHLKTLEVPDGAWVQQRSKNGKQSNYRYGKQRATDGIPAGVMRKLGKQLQEKKFARP